MAINKLNATLSKCDGCGNNMVYDPAIGALFCRACKSKKAIERIAGLPMHDVDSTKSATSKAQQWENPHNFMECPNCGAHVMLNQNDVSGKCHYCNTSLVSSENIYSTQQPDSIIPFKLTKSQAESLFKEKLGNKFFAPKKFKKSIIADEIHSLYFPSFVFKASCSTHYSGRLYEEYSERDKDGNSTTKRRYFSVDDFINTNHPLIPIETSERLTQRELCSINPYDYSEACNYSNEYVYGYNLDCNNKDVATAGEEAKEEIKRTIEREIVRKHHADGISELKLNINYSSFKYSYCVLPVYRFNYKYKNKDYTNLINGQTGALGGSYPKSVFKILMTILIPIGIVALVWLTVILSIIGKF